MYARLIEMTSCNVQLPRGQRDNPAIKFRFGRELPKTHTGSVIGPHRPVEIVPTIWSLLLLYHDIMMPSTTRTHSVRLISAT